MRLARIEREHPFVAHKVAGELGCGLYFEKNVFLFAEEGLYRSAFISNQIDSETSRVDCGGRRQVGLFSKADNE